MIEIWYNITTKKQGASEMKKRKTIKIKVDTNPLDYVKETPQQRKERVRNSKPLGTRVEKDKSKYTRKQKHKERY